MSTYGPTEALIKRHQLYIRYYNANCDRIRPKSLQDVRTDVYRHETEMTACSPRTLLDPTELDTYAVDKDAIYQDLIHRIRCSKHTEKPVKRVKLDLEPRNV